MLLALHLSCIEFGCAASLCRKDIDLEKELAQIHDSDRFASVIMYIVGMFSRNSSIEFLTMCKSLCENFLDLLDNKERKRSIQAVFNSILVHRQETSKSDRVTLVTQTENININISILSLLADSMLILEEKVQKLHVKAVRFPMSTDEQVNIVQQFENLQLGKETVVSKWDLSFDGGDFQDWEVARHWLSQKKITPMSAKVTYHSLGKNMGTFLLLQVPCLQDMTKASELYDYLKDGTELCRMIGLVTKGHVLEGITYRY